MPSLKKLSILIPVYNEITYLPEIVRQIQEINIPLEKELIFIEGGSTDGSTEFVREICDQYNYKAIFETKPTGKGAAIIKGMKVGTGDIFIIQDADLEYTPSDYPKLLAPILKQKTKFVLGSRNFGAGTWKFRRYLNSFWYANILNVGSLVLNYLFNVLYGVKLSDPQTMYKVFHRDCIKGIVWHSKRFDFDWELVGKLVRLKHIPIEIPVHYQGRSAKEGKKVKIWPDAWFNLMAIIRFRFSKITSDSAP